MFIDVHSSSSTEKVQTLSLCCFKHIHVDHVDHVVFDILLHLPKHCLWCRAISNWQTNPSTKDVAKPLARQLSRVRPEGHWLNMSLASAASCQMPKPPEARENRNYGNCGRHAVRSGSKVFVLSRNSVEDMGTGSSAVVQFQWHISIMFRVLQCGWGRVLKLSMDSSSPPAKSAFTRWITLDEVTLGQSRGLATNPGRTGLTAESTSKFENQESWVERRIWETRAKKRELKEERIQSQNQESKIKIQKNE